MPDYAVRTTFSAKDKVSPTFDRMGRSADRMAQKTSSAFRNATKDGYKFMTIVKGILAANLIRGGIGQIGTGIQKLSQDFLSFDDIIIGAVARFDDIGPGAKDAAQKVGWLGKEVRKSIAGSRFTAVDAAKATNELAKAGYASASALGVMPKILAFATANQEDLAEATTMSSDILGAFGLRSKNVQEQLKNHIALNDMLTKSSLLSTGGLRDLYETLQQTAPISKEIRVMPNELLALSVALSNAGIKGTEAATAIKRAQLQIFAGNMGKEFKANGIEIADAKTGKLRKFTDILGDIGKKLAPLREDVRVPIIRKIFGMYGLAGSIKLMRELGQITEYEQKILDSQGVTDKVASMQNTSTLAKLLMLANTAMEKGFQILEAFNAKGQQGIEGLIERIKKFDVKPVVKAIGQLIGIAKTLWNVFEPFLPMLPALIKLWLGWKLLLGGKAVFTAGKDAYMLGKNLIWTYQTLTKLPGPLGAVTKGLGVLSGHIALIAANFLIWKEVWDSATTGKDNWFSKMAQSIGIVPKLATNADGVVTGNAPDSEQNWLWRSGTSDIDLSDWSAPNEKEAQARKIQFNGNLNIAGAPPGSTFTSNTYGAPPIQAHMLGANP